MEMVLNNGFCEMTQEDMEMVDGGFIIALIAIGSATYAITSGMVLGSVATAWTLGHAAYEIVNAFRK